MSYHISGYQIIDLRGVASGGTLAGIWDKIESNYDKPVMLQGVTVAGTNLPALFTQFFADSSSERTAQIGGLGTITVSDADVVTFTASGGGGGGALQTTKITTLEAVPSSAFANSSVTAPEGFMDEFVGKIMGLQRTQILDMQFLDTRVLSSVRAAGSNGFDFFMPFYGVFSFSTSTNAFTKVTSE